MKIDLIIIKNMKTKYFWSLLVMLLEVSMSLS